MKSDVSKAKNRLVSFAFFIDKWLDIKTETEQLNSVFETTVSVKVNTYCREGIMQYM